MIHLNAMSEILVKDLAMEVSVLIPFLQSQRLSEESFKQRCKSLGCCNEVHQASLLGDAPKDGAKSL